jgi:hypothetical protein
MEYTTDYFWVVICKNRRFHHRGNTSYEHQIPLGATDQFSSRPVLTARTTNASIVDKVLDIEPGATVRCSLLGLHSW